MPILLNPWPYDYIRKLADEATLLAQQQGLRPALVTEVIATYKHSHRFNIPFLGDYVHEGWSLANEMVDPVFVDVTGRGQPGDPAITAFEFFKRAEHLNLIVRDSILGFGVIEQGQLQALVATYRKETHGKANET